MYVCKYIHINVCIQVCTSKIHNHMKSKHDTNKRTAKSKRHCRREGGCDEEAFGNMDLVLEVCDLRREARRFVKKNKAFGVILAHLLAVRALAFELHCFPNLFSFSKTCTYSIRDSTL